jgi:hypothetical protein
LPTPHLGRHNLGVIVAAPSAPSSRHPQAVIARESGQSSTPQRQSEPARVRGYWITRFRG